ncbi:2Fe-2S iron-sulfur cluster-binding protein [Microbacterium sp. YJN-G]|uniref:2Fe-2S iron-sulfur cluster-binding protein n=1 Tax=Microbacterium sp. YJN-G TaxID=2763257 RepID=UPI001D0C3759|nr:2Fe-2S iron-sulfur cluster-binding protein [Microbacterium sp. YJN-G]
MAEINFWDAETDDLILTADIRRNDSVMEVAVRAGVEGIIAECGGSMSCGTCHVYAAPEESALFEEKDSSEDEMLAEIENCAANSRLSCQMILVQAEGTANVRVPAAP